MMNQTSSDVEERRENIAGAANVGPEGITPPDRKRFQREMDEIAERIRDLDAKLKSLEKQILSHSGVNSKANVYVDREKLLRERQELRAQREKTIEERKKIDLDLKGLNDQVQRKGDACAKLKAGLRHKTEAGIDEAVKRLERQVQVQQHKIKDERRLVAEINKLKRSKRNLSEYWSLKEEVDLLRNNQTMLRARRDECVKQLNRMKSREEVVKNLLESSDNSTVEEEESRQAELVKKKEDIKQELIELRNKKKNLNDNFSMEKRKYKEEVKEMKAQKQKEVLTRRKNVSQKEMETNRSIKQHKPFEKEKVLCDTLIVHLEKLHVSQAPDVSSATASDKELSLPQRADAEFSGSDSEGTFLPRKSATDDLFDVFGGNSRIHRKGSRKGRRSSIKEGPRKLNLQLEVVENILALDLTPPSSALDIPKILEKLREKKNFYESAATSKDLVAHSSHDPMTPITEEAAPEFPSSFIGSAVSENPGHIAQGDDALAKTNVLPVSSNEALLEKGDNSFPSSTENDIGSLQAEDIKGTDLKLRDNLLLEECAAVDIKSTVALQVDETAIKGEGRGSDNYSAIHQKDEVKFEEGSAEGVESQDLFRPLEGATSNAEENNSGSREEGGRNAKSKDELLIEETKTPFPVFPDNCATREAVSVSLLMEKDRGDLEGNSQSGIDQVGEQPYKEGKETGSLQQVLSSSDKTEEEVPEEDDVGQTTGEKTFSKQSSCNSASEIHRCGSYLPSSPHSNRLVEHNSAFDRTSLNEGGAMVNMLGLGEEKCPA